MARRRAARDRRRGRAAGRGRRVDRARRTRALPASARPLGGLPRGGPERPPRRAPGARRRDRPGPRSRPSRLASRARDGDAGRGGGRGDGALGRPRAGPRRAGRGRRVPAAGGRADAGPRRARRALARRGPGEARRRRRRVRVRPPGRRRARAASTSSSARGWSGCAREIVFASRRGRDAPPLLLEAARRLDPLDAAIARETYLEAIASAMFAGRLGTGPDEREVAEAARASTRAPAPGAADVLLDAPRDAVHRGVRGVGRAALAGAARVRRARRRREDRRWLWLACRLAQDLWDDELWHVLATRGVRVARDTGALNLLPNALNYLAALNVHSGDFATAAALIDEVDAITQATGLPPLKYAACMLAAARGDQAQMQVDRRHRGCRTRRRAARARRYGGHWWLTALLHNGHGQLRRGARGRAAGLRARGRHGVRLGPGRADRGRRPRRPAATRPPPRSSA